MHGPEARVTWDPMTTDFTSRRNRISSAAIALPVKPAPIENDDEQRYFHVVDLPAPRAQACPFVIARTAGGKNRA